MPTLRFHRGGHSLFEYRLRAGRTTIGRADSCDVALPDESISRTHCIVEGRGASWLVVDRSRHGIEVDGAPAVGRTELSDGSEIAIGAWRVVVSLSDRKAQPTSAPTVPAHHEVVHGLVDGRVVSQQAMLVVVSGPDAGTRSVLDRARVGVGGPGSVIELSDASLLRNHVYLRISRGRAMVEPGEGIALHDGVRVRSITPLYGDEDFRIGETTIRVEQTVQEDDDSASGFGDMIGESVVMKRVFGQLRRMASHDYTVLVVGPSGSGKELVARGIHDHSTRAEQPFVAVNCGAISANLFESELFGHEKGAFTGADRRRDGAFQEADGGTLFLDEVGELPEDAQAKLLRALETGEVRRVGSTRPTTPDVRIVAATNRDLPAEVAAGRFREDLFFRLAVLTIELPPLRERLEDLSALAAHMCSRLDPGCRLSPEGRRVLLGHHWPGNVRELRNVLTRAFVLGGPSIGPEHLSFHQISAPTSAMTPPDGMKKLEVQERSFIAGVLERNGGNRSASARELGIARSTLHYKMRRLGLT